MINHFTTRTDALSSKRGHTIQSVLRNDHPKEFSELHQQDASLICKNLNGCKPNLSHLRVFRSIITLQTSERNAKLDQNNEIALLMIFSSTDKNICVTDYHIMDLLKNVAVIEKLCCPNDITRNG